MKTFSLNFWTANYENSKVGTKTYRGIRSQLEHNYREEEQDINYLVRPELTKYNLTYSKHRTEEGYKEEIEKIKADYQEHYKRKPPSNLKPFINGLLTFSQTMQEDIKTIEPKRLLKIVKDFLLEEFGEVLHYSIHLDETTPHIHFICHNWNFKTHKTHSKTLDKQLKENELRQSYQQDRLDSHFKKNNIDYNRGDIRSIKQKKNEVKTYQEYTKELENNLKEKEKKIKELEHKIEDMKAKGQEIQNNLNSEIKELKTTKQNLELDFLKIIDAFEIIKQEWLSIELENDNATKYQKFLKMFNKSLNNKDRERMNEVLNKAERTIKAIKKNNNKVKTI